MLQNLWAGDDLRITVLQLPFIKVSKSFLEPLKLSHPLGKVSYAIIISLYVIFLQQESPSPQNLTLANEVF